MTFERKRGSWVSEPRKPVKGGFPVADPPLGRRSGRRSGPAGRSRRLIDLPLSTCGAGLGGGCGAGLRGKRRRNVFASGSMPRSSRRLGWLGVASGSEGWFVRSLARAATKTCEGCLVGLAKRPGACPDDRDCDRFPRERHPGLGQTLPPATGSGRDGAARDNGMIRNAAPNPRPGGVAIVAGRRCSAPAKAQAPPA